MTKTYKMSHRLAALLTGGALSVTGGSAFAASFDATATNIQSATTGFQNLIALVAYLGGAGLGVTGILKLKQHVDNPSSAPMKDGIARVLAGGSLLAFPYFSSAMVDAIAADGGNTGPTPGTLDPFQ